MGTAVSGLYRYPVKGCAGVSVDALPLDDVGPVGDRRWMIVSPDGRDFFTQREHPSLALVRVELIASGLRFSAPGVPSIEVAEPSFDAPRRRVRIWADEVEARDAGDAAAGWMEEYLGTTARLVRLGDDVVRPVDPARARPGFPSRVALADGYPILLLSEASCRDVEAKLPPDADSIGVDRFRPNVVVSGCGPWEEDEWRRIEVSGIAMEVVKPCARCVAITVNQSTGTKGREPLATLALFRKADGAVFVGQNILHVGAGTVRVGDPVSVVERGAPRPELGNTEAAEPVE